MFNKFTCVLDGKSRIRTHCNTCGQVSIHSIEATLSGDWGDRDYAGWEEHSLVRCGGCDTVKYSATLWDEQDFEIDEDGEYYHVKNPKYYPAAQTKKLDHDYLLNTPLSIHNVLTEVLRSQANNDLILSTMGLRLLLEVVCNGAKCKAKTLAKKIGELEANGLIGSEEKSLFHQIRTFGNAGAHLGDAMSSDQIASGLEMCLDLIDKLFVQPAKKTKMLATAKTKLTPSKSTTGS